MNMDHSVWYTGFSKSWVFFKLVKKNMSSSELSSSNFEHEVARVGFMQKYLTVVAIARYSKPTISSKVTSSKVFQDTKSYSIHVSPEYVWSAALARTSKMRPRGVGPR